MEPCPLPLRVNETIAGPPVPPSGSFLHLWSTSLHLMFNSCVSSLTATTTSFFFSLSLFLPGGLPLGWSIEGAITKRQTDMSGLQTLALSTGGPELTDRNHYAVPTQITAVPAGTDPPHAPHTHRWVCIHTHTHTQIKITYGAQVREKHKHVNACIQVHTSICQ